MKAQHSLLKAICKSMTLKERSSSLVIFALFSLLQCLIIWLHLQTGSHASLTCCHISKNVTSQRTLWDIHWKTKKSNFFLHCSLKSKIFSNTANFSEKVLLWTWYMTRLQVELKKMIMRKTPVKIVWNMIFYHFLLMTSRWVIKYVIR
jgi:hypothetical protein